MAHRSFAFITLCGAIAATLSLAAAADIQDAARTPLMLASSKVTIAGTSNVHAYTASTTEVRLTRLQIAGESTAPLVDPFDRVLEPGVLESFEIAIAAGTLSSPKDGLDKNMHKALKVQEHRDITFRLVRLEPARETGVFTAIGKLRIAGVEREVALTLKTLRRAASLAITGEVKLLMTDYGITPPKAMLGMLKTDPGVTVTFETVLTVPLT